MNKTTLLTAICLATSTIPATADGFSGQDTTRVIDIEEVTIVSSPKETAKLKQLPASISIFSQQKMQENQVTSLKNIGTLVPNFYIPDYGSRITSAMYIRGIGSRINTPAVGMYVDNIPYLDKSAFDFHFYDIERLDILRGPQGTLYGRNTMGGLVKVHTRSPFSHQGTDVKLSYGTKDNHRSASLNHYSRLNKRFALAVGGYYEGSDGFFENGYTLERVDDMQAGGGRLRAIWLPNETWKLNFTVSYDYTDEGGYPYYYTGVTKGEEDRQELVGQLAYNRESTYRRSLLNAGLNAEYQAGTFTLNAVTGFQHLEDRMYMDQDFSPLDIYTLEQRQRINSLTEEISIKSKPGSNWQWTTGIFGFYQNMRTDSPVDFYTDGIDFLNQSINSNFPDLSSQGMDMSMQLTGDRLHIPTLAKTPTLSGAIFHQSTLRLGNWEVTAGLRLEHEHMEIDYDSRCRETTFDFNLQGGPTMQIPLSGLKAQSTLAGSLKNDYTQLLPKLAAKYNINSHNHLYASITKGYRSGGYNLQMFSDLAQNELRNAMQAELKPNLNTTLDQLGKRGMPAQVIAMIKGMTEQYLQPTPVDVASSIVYKPEYSWNYELGTRLTLFGGKLKTDIALFYIDTRDQQIARFVESGLGRIMVNAGRSESYGAELSLAATPDRHWRLEGSYGYTHATFKEYDGGTDSDNTQADYSGNRVPYVPEHTMSVGASYTLFLRNSFVEQLTFGTDYTGAGRIYWTEQNNACQNFYGTLNGRIALKAKNMAFTLWGRNLTNTDYATFYFESMGRGFEQKSKPIRFGIDIQLFM